MLYSFFLSKKGYTFVEVLIVVALLGILVAVGVPVFGGGLAAQKKKDCNNQSQVVETAFKETLGGMIDNGRAQDEVDFNLVKVRNPSLVTTYLGDGENDTADDGYVNKECIMLTKEDGRVLTIGDIRGGYRQDYGQYTDDADGYRLGCDDGHYLKKKALENDPFYVTLYNEEIPVCPFADFENTDTKDDYHYYIFADGTVLCDCPHCNEVD